MKISFEKVYERDIDLLVMRLLSGHKSVLDYFCEKIQKKGFSLKEIAHSVFDIDGESDIVLKLECSEKIHLLMIENKINAAAQPEQYNRYKIRGEKQVEAGYIDSYSICLIAPSEYISGNQKAQEYAFAVTYEELLSLDAVKHDSFATALLNKSIEKQKSTCEINLAVSEFWQNYHIYQKEFYPLLNLNYSSTQKGPAATWPSFKTGIPGTRIIHKSELGYVDLEFSGKADIQSELAQKIKPFKDEDMRWHPTGGSASLGIEVSKMDFKMSFADYKEQMLTVLDAVSRLQKLVLRLYDEGIVTERKNV